MLSSRNLFFATVTAAALTISAATLSGQAAGTICKDGTKSVSSGRGACSGHGGVAKKAPKKEVTSETKTAKTTKAAPSAKTTTLCADGTTSSSSGRGACSSHGGVKGAEAPSKTTTAPAAAPKKATPQASATASSKASSKSAVAAGSGAADDNNPAGAIARCKDGLYSHATHRQGACGHHGGVASWL